jgi:hypothetical protein
LKGFGDFRSRSPPCRCHRVWALWITDPAATARVLGTKASLGMPRRDPRNSAMVEFSSRMFAPMTVRKMFGVAATTEIHCRTDAGSSAEIAATAAMRNERSGSSSVGRLASACAKAAARCRIMTRSKSSLAGKYR